MRLPRWQGSHPHSMKKLSVLLLASYSATALSAQPTLLENALSCKLKDSELPSLMRELAVQQPAFAKPAEQVSAPSADIYRLNKPASAFGYASAEVVVTPGRILLALPGASRGKAISTLKLQEADYAPASRVIRPTVSLVAFQLSHQALANKLLVGCEYANADAAGWVQP